MIAKQKQARLLFPFIALLLTLSLTIASCGGTPTPKPQPTFALEVSPGTEVQVGKSVAIVAKVKPLEKLNLKWSVSGTAEGALNTREGEQVVYTAGKEGTDIVVAEGTTASGAPVKQTVTLTVVGEPTSTAAPVPPIEAPTEMPTPAPVATPVLPTPTPLPVDTITLTYPQNDQSVPCENLAKGTYSLDIKNHIWPVVYIAGRFHPQDEGGKAPPMSGGKWYGTVRFGMCDQPDRDRGKVFQLLIVTADEQANRIFEDYLAAYRPTGEYPGMDSLPEGIKEYVRIIVIRE